MSAKKTVIFLILVIVTVILVVFKKENLPPNTTTVQGPDTFNNEDTITASTAADLTAPFQNEISASSKKNVDLDKASNQTRANTKKEGKDTSPAQAIEIEEAYIHENKLPNPEKLIDIKGVFFISFFPKLDSPLDLLIKNSTEGFFYFSKGQVIEKPDEKNLLKRFCAIELWKNPDYSRLNSDGILSTWISKQTINAGPGSNRTSLIFFAHRKSFRKRILRILKVVAIDSGRGEFSTDFTLSELEKCFNSSIEIDYPKLSTQ
jgi:hypothetical protein